MHRSSRSSLAEEALRLAVPELAIWMIGHAAVGTRISAQPVLAFLCPVALDCRVAPGPIDAGATLADESWITVLAV